MIGIDPASIEPLSFVGPPSEGDLPDKQARLCAVAADWIESHVGTEYFSWERHWHHVPYDLLARAFTREELIRLWHNSVCMSKLSEHLERHESLVWKVQHSLWRYGCARDYNRFVACLNGLGRISADLPDFDVRLTHTRFCNTAAWADHGRDGTPIYLDAPFGVLLHYKGVHVMTIGFALSSHGILVAQVQLRQKRGNRFLYRLPLPHLDFALELLRRAFPEDPLWLVTGTSTTAAIRAAYGKEDDRLTPEASRRIESFYDHPLRDWVRTGKPIRCNSDDGRAFVRLRCAGDASRSAEVGRTLPGVFGGVLGLVSL